MNLPSLAAPRRKSARRIGAIALSVAVLASAGVATGIASAEASNISSAPLDILLGVGATESQRIVSWYYPSSAAQSLELEKKSDLGSGDIFNDKKSVLTATTAANTATDTSSTDPVPTPGQVDPTPSQTGYYNSHVTLRNLQPNTTYSYHLGAKDGSNWSPTYTFKTQSFTGDFDFLFFGDPQIGSSGDTDQDGAGWAATLDYATTRTPNAELLVSGGDQVEKANNEYQWSAFADGTGTTVNKVLKQYPWAATIGNHDVGGKAYEQHNSLPNLSKDADYYPDASKIDTNSGGDYYYIYKGVLFIDLNSNAYDGNSDAAHVDYVRSVINAVGDKAKWKVLVYHHSIYSPADHANDGDNIQRRTDFTTAFSDLGVNLVLQGHDHSYSRSYAILNGKKANVDEQPGQDEVFSGPGGVIYVTANSASGSKYYDLTNPDASKGGYGADPLDQSTGHKRHFANSVENQEHVRTYVQVSVTGDKLNVSDIRAGDCSAPNSAVTRTSPAPLATCGAGLPATAAGAAAATAAIGTSVDHFALDAALPATTVALSSSKSSTLTGSTTPITLTATVGGGLGKLSGDVDFFDGTTPLGSTPLSGGTASLTLPASLTVGVHSYTAKFTSKSAFTSAGGTSAAATVQVSDPLAPPAPPVPPVVVKAVSTTTLAYAKGTATIAVTAPNVAVNGSATIYDGTTVLKTVPVVNGTATAKVTVKKVGTHVLHADFAVTDTIAASTSNTVSVKIAKSTTSLKYTKGAVTVTVKHPSKAAGSAKVYDGKKVVKTVKIVKGKATVKLHLKKGTHKLHAVFGATDTIAASTSKTIKVKIVK